MRITLKDIAERCHVSTTLVSAVLNNQHGKVRYSDETGELIRQTARQLGYHPNLIARTMASRRSPVVGVMMSTDSVGIHDSNFDYFNVVFPMLTELLNKKGLEVLFLPFHNEKEQCERLAKAIAAGLVGSVITNIIPDSYQQIVPQLQNSGLPYMILGNPAGLECHCAYTAFDFSWSASFIRHRNLRDSVLVTMINNELQCHKLPFTDDYFWTSTPLSDGECRWGAADRLFICTDLNALHAMPEIPANVILLTTDEVIPPGIPAAVITHSYLPRLSYAVETLCQWLDSGIAPLPRKVCMDPRPIKKFINFDDAEIPDSYFTNNYKEA